MDLAVILLRINQIEDQDVRSFLLCAFSNILKGCSRWMMKSTKPTIDKKKVIAVDAVYKKFCTSDSKDDDKKCRVLENTWY